MKPAEKYRQAIVDLLAAIKKCEAVGCIEHLDCWDEAGAEWYAPIERAKDLLK